MLRTLLSTLLAASFLLPAAGLAAEKSKESKESKKAKASEKVAKAEKAQARQPDADAAFVAAKDAYASLKKDSKRRKFRDGWIAVAQKFESVADKFPQSSRAADALYAAAELYAELSRVSLAKRDLKEALEAYGRLCEKYPRSNLADDAHLALGRIYRDRKGDTAMAEAEFKASAACKGDMQSKARQELAELASMPKPKAQTPARGEETALHQAFAKADSKPEPRPASKPEPRPEAKLEARPAEPVALARAAPARGEDDDEEYEAEALNIPIASPTRQPIDPARVKALKAASKSEVPLSVQVGLKVKRIIIDPGHGGHDVGAIGPKGTYEKDITLAISEKLKARLEADGYEALMTRDDDAFVSLEDRARFANRNKGDLFVSVHCNALKAKSFRGVETYTLNVTSNQYAIRLAARENASSERSLGDLQIVLADLATKVNTGDSQRLARAIQSEVVEAQSDSKVKAKNLGVKQALFYVLLGAKMPSVLVETAFITNPEDEKLLGEADKQQAIADGMAEGIGRFVSEREALATALPE
ncbi:MAG TPA: N-acetylmuramoyl-L-alanine amidase [Myxococcales bacterium]|jgi:N-acetylmuramoyl-L-alanine amidase